MENNIVPNNRLTLEEFINELEAVKYKFSPKNRKQLKRLGYIRVGDSSYMMDTVDDSSMRGIFKAEMLGRHVENISFIFLVDFGCPREMVTLEKFNEVIEPFYDAVVEVFGFNNVAFPVFCPYEDDGFDPNETPDKYGIKDFLEGKAIYGRSGEDETGMMMQIVSTLHERVDENTCISLSLVRYNERLGDRL